MQNLNKMRWNSKITVVDVNTGAVLTQKHVSQGLYVVLKKTVKYLKQNDYYGTKHIRWECIENPQRNLFRDNAEN